MLLNGEIDYGGYSVESYNLKKEQKILGCANKTLLSHCLDSDLRTIVHRDTKMHEKIVS